MWQIQKWHLTGPLGWSLEYVHSICDTEKAAQEKVAELNSSKRHCGVEYRAVLVD